MFLDQIETGLSGEPTAIPESLRVVSWNINRGLQFDAVVEFLAKRNPDVILLQECDSNAERTGHRNIAREISSALRMNHVFGVEFQELTQNRNHSAAFHGQATLCRWPLLNPRLLRFSNQSRFWRPRWWIPNLPMFQRRVGGRIALVTLVTIGEITFAVYNLHLESRGQDNLRRLQLSELLMDIEQRCADMPVVIAGDFNFNLTDLFASSSLHQAKICNPFRNSTVKTVVPPSPEQKGAIDWILTKGPISAESPQVHSSVFASDHFPLSLTLKLTGSTS